MFLGHYGAAYALKRVEPRVSLGTLFLSVTLVDTMWGLFLLTGWEQARIFPGLTPVTPIEFTRYPLSHSLVAAFAWALFVAAVVYTWPTRDTSKHHWLKALVAGIAVASHWFLDLIVHIPDLPLAGDTSTKLGFGLWRSLPATLAAAQPARRLFPPAPLSPLTLSARPARTCSAATAPSPRRLTTSRSPHLM